MTIFNTFPQKNWKPRVKVLGAHHSFSSAVLAYGINLERGQFYVYSQQFDKFSE